MLLKSELIKLLLLLCVVTLTSAATIKPRYRHFCPLCEEEVWEEVPCYQVSKTYSTVTTTPSPPISPIAIPPTTQTPTTYTTMRPYSLTRPTTEATFSYVENTSAVTTHVPTSTAASVYNRCYCECKTGCKEFCRKLPLVGGSSDKKITQIVKSSQRVKDGHIESEHIHHHRFVPDGQVSDNTIIPPTNIPSTEKKVYYIESGKSHNDNQHNEQINVAYEAVQPDPVPPQLPHHSHVPLPQEIPASQTMSMPSHLSNQSHTPLPQPVPSQSLYQPHEPLPQTIPIFHNQQTSPGVYDNYPDVLVDASYSVDELTRLLQTEILNKDPVITYGQPSMYTPSYNSYDSSLRAENADAQVHMYRSSSASESNHSSPQPATEQNYEANFSLVPHYEQAAYTTDTDNHEVVDTTAPQYSNYIAKNYESSHSGVNINQQSEHSYDHLIRYENHERKYRSSVPNDSIDIQAGSQPTSS